MTTKHAKPSPQANRNWSIAVVIALLIGAYFLRNFLATLAFAAITAYLFNPVYVRLVRRRKIKPGLAAGIVTLLAILTVVIPLAIIAALAVQQLGEMIAGLQNSNFSINDGYDEVNRFLSRYISRTELFSTAQIQEFASQRLPGIFGGVVDTALQVASSVPGLILQTIVFLFSFFAFHTRQAGILKALYSISPFDDELTSLYLTRIGAMTRSMFTGQLLIAVLQGLASALAMFAIGMGQYFVLFWIFFTLMSFIPLGAGLITIPMGIIAMLLGNFWGGLIVIANHMLIVSSIDNIRPWLTPREAQLPPLLTLLGALAGVQAFGFLGVIYGPVIMIVIMTTVTTYVDRGGATYLVD